MKYRLTIVWDEFDGKLYTETHDYDTRQAAEQAKKDIHKLYGYTMISIYIREAA